MLHLRCKGVIFHSSLSAPRLFRTTAAPSKEIRINQTISPLLSENQALARGVRSVGSTSFGDNAPRIVSFPVGTRFALHTRTDITL